MWTDPLRQGEHQVGVKYVLGRATNRGDEGQNETERNKHPTWSSGRNDKGIAQVVNDLSNPPSGDGKNMVRRGSHEVIAELMGDVPSFAGDLAEVNPLGLSIQGGGGRAVNPIPPGIDSVPEGPTKPIAA